MRQPTCGFKTPASKRVNNMLCFWKSSDLQSQSCAGTVSPGHLKISNLGNLAESYFWFVTSHSYLVLLIILLTFGQRFLQHSGKAKGSLQWIRRLKHICMTLPHPQTSNYSLAMLSKEQQTITISPKISHKICEIRRGDGRGGSGEVGLPAVSPAVDHTANVNSLVLAERGTFVKHESNKEELQLSISRGCAESL